MSRLVFGRGNVSPPIRGLNPLTVLGNNRLVSVEARSRIAEYVNAVSACRRRVLAQWSVRPGDMAGVGAPATWTTIQYFRIRPSYQMTRVRAVVVAIPSDSTGATSTPALRFVHVESGIASPGLPNYYNIMHIGRRDTGSIVPNDYMVLTQTLGPESNSTQTDYIVPGTAFDIYLQGRGGARVLSVTLFEEFGPLYQDENFIGDGDSFSDTGNYTQIIDASRTFEKSLIGGLVTVSGATTSANNGSYRIHAIPNNTTIQYLNSGGATEAFGANTRYRIRAPSVENGRAGSPILNDGIEKMLQVPYNIWKDGGGHLFEWADENTPRTRSSATYANIHNTGLTAWSSSAPGHWTWPYKQGSYESAQCPVVMWAYADCTGAGTGGVRFLVNGRTVGTVAVGATLAVTTATGYLDSSNATDKVDVHFAGDGAATCSVFSYGMYQYSAT